MKRSRSVSVTVAVVRMTVLAFLCVNWDRSFAVTSKVESVSPSASTSASIPIAKDLGVLPNPKAALCKAATRPPSDGWQLVTPPGVVYTAAIATDPFVTGTIWMSARNANDAGAKGKGGLFESTDCGSPDSWTWVTDPADRTNNASAARMVNRMWTWSMALDFLTSGTIYLQDNYAWSGDGPEPNGLSKSADFGKTWKKVINLSDRIPAVINGRVQGTGQVPNVASVSMDPTDPLHLVVGAHDNCPNPGFPVCQVESFDGGKTWRLLQLDPKNSFPDSNVGAAWQEQSGPQVLNHTSWLFTGLFNTPWLTTNSAQTFSRITRNTSYIGIFSSGGGEWTTQPMAPSALGYYYLASRQAPGIIYSKDARTWAEVPNVIPRPISQAPTYFPQYGDLAFGGGRVFLGDLVTGYVIWANEPIPPMTWTDTANIEDYWHVLPTKGLSTTPSGGAYFLKYDEVNHILYASRANAQLSRIYVP